MRPKLHALILATLFSTTLALANGILPGEPDPNLSPQSDRLRDNQHDTVLLDDRKPCSQGMKRFQKMKCGIPEAGTPDCQNYSPVLECRKTAQALHCKKPQVPVPSYRCE